MTPTGIELATFRLVAQGLNQRIHHCYYLLRINYKNEEWPAHAISAGNTIFIRNAPLDNISKFR